MNVWLRTRRSARVSGALALGGALALLTVPMAIAVEGTATETTTTDSTTQTLEEPEPLLEPSPTGSSLGTTDTSSTEPVEDETGAIDDTLDTVEDTDETGTLDTITEPVRGVIAPTEEPTEEEPTGGASEGDTDPAKEPSDDSSGESPARDSTEEAAGDTRADAEAAPSTPLPAEPAAATGVRRPFSPDSAAFAGGPDDPHAAEAADLMAKLTAMDDPQGYGPPDGALLKPGFLLAGPQAAEVTVPLGPRSTRDILEAMGAAADFAGTVARTLAPFPVAGPATYSDDFGAPRHVPSFHDHAGTDLFAPRGTPVIASADGTVRNMGVDTAIGGNSLKLFTADGTYFYYAHLEGFAAGIGDGAEVELGQVLGFVGDSGNALGTPPHLHYEIHPGGGEAVNPVPYLDRWLANARAAAQSLAGASQGVWTPQVAPPAGAPAATTDTAQASPDGAGATAAVQTDPGLTNAGGDTSPLSVLIVVGSAAVLFAMLRRPRGSSQPTGPSSSTAAAAPNPAPLMLLPLPGEEPQVEAEEEDEFQWITVGA